MLLFNRIFIFVAYGLGDVYVEGSRVAEVGGGEGRRGGVGGGGGEGEGEWKKNEREGGRFTNLSRRFGGS